MRRKKDEGCLRSVFRLMAPAFEAREEQIDDDPVGWGVYLLAAAFDDCEDADMTDLEDYGRTLQMTLEGVEVEVKLGFRGPDWIGFINSNRPLPDAPAVRAALVEVDRLLRAVEGVTDLGWMDLSTFDKPNTEEEWAERPWTADTVL